MGEGSASQQLQGLRSTLRRILSRVLLTSVPPLPSKGPEPARPGDRSPAPLGVPHKVALAVLDASRGGLVPPRSLRPSVSFGRGTESRSLGNGGVPWRKQPVITPTTGSRWGRGLPGAGAQGPTWAGHAQNSGASGSHSSVPRTGVVDTVMVNKRQQPWLQLPSPLRSTL